MTTSVIEKTKVQPRVGDIFYTSWGYDQTNIEFFQVVKVSPSSVWVQETGQIVESTDWGRDYWKTVSDRKPKVSEWRNWDVPGEYITKIADINIHRINWDADGTPYIKFKHGYKWGYFWDGTPKTASTGH